jgi:competence protein ComEC
MLSCLLAALFQPLAAALAWVISWPIRYVLLVSGLLAKFPLAAVYTDSVYIVFWLIVAYILLAAFFITKKKYPAITALGILVLLFLCVALSWLEPRQDDTRISVINVGQGQSILIQQEDAFYLVDCGGSHAEQTADTVTNFLFSQGIFHLDGVILTHYDEDHTNSTLQMLGLDSWFGSYIRATHYMSTKALAVLDLKYSIIVTWYQVYYPREYQQIMTDYNV